MVTIASTLNLSTLAFIAGTGLVAAQDVPARDLPARDLPQNGGAGIRGGHITATGETMPNPGVSQGGGTTSMDRGIERRNDEIQSSICKGC